MNAEEAKLIVKEENGEEKEYYKLFTFDSEETGKSYVAYTDYSTDDKGNIVIRANTYDPTGADMSLQPLTSEKEWKVIENILISTQEKMREAMEKESSADESEEGTVANG